MGGGEDGLGLKRQSLFVCWFCAHWPIVSIFSLTTFSPQPAFAADSSITDTAGDGPPVPALKPTRLDPRIVVPVIAASALLFALLLAMGILKLLRLRLKRRRSNRVVVVAEDSGETGGAAGTGEKDVGVSSASAVAAPVVREFNWADIRKMTGNFEKMIGTGGFSTVYLGRFSGGAASRSALGAVKVHTGSERLNLAFRQELDILLRISHENIVKLIGFCDDEGNPPFRNSIRNHSMRTLAILDTTVRSDSAFSSSNVLGEGALVFEYIPNGNLQEKLHGHRSGTDSVLSWRNRMAIAHQLARAIEYLHERCSPQIVHGDVKASNILLDGGLNCKLCDFGSAKMGFSSLVELNFFFPFLN